MTAPTLTTFYQGGSAVSADNYNTFIQWAPTSSYLLTYQGAAPGQIVVLGGNAALNDGGGGQFYWNAAGTASDGINNFQPNGVSVGCWTRITYTAAVNPTGVVAINPQSGLTYVIGNKDAGTCILAQNTGGLMLITLDNTAEAGVTVQVHQDVSSVGVQFSATAGAPDVVNTYGPFHTIRGPNCSVWLMVLDNVGGSSARWRLDGQLTAP